MDIIVTTPKSQIANAALEAEAAKLAGGGEYFRRFQHTQCPPIWVGARVYYVEDGYVRGFCAVSRIEHRSFATRCATTGRVWAVGWYVFMAAKTWQWIRAIPMGGFRGYRAAAKAFNRRDVEIVGGWLDPKPEISSAAPAKP